MPKIHAGTCAIFYEDAGAGEPLVLVPGLAADHAGWAQSQVPAFVAAGYRCISIDNRDVGQSDPSPIANYTIQDMSEDTAGVIEALGLGPAHILGWSMGGMIAQELALNHVQCVRSLTLYATDAGQDPLVRAWLKGMILIRSKCNLHEFAQATCAWLFGAQFFGQSGAAEAFIDMTSANPYPQSAGAFTRQCEAILTHTTAGRLGSIRVPTHVIVGEQDIIHRPRSSRLLAEKISGATLTAILFI